MGKNQKGTKVCSICHIRKPISEFLLSTSGYAKKYSNVCHACRLKKRKKAFFAKDEDEGGKSGGLKIDYNAKLFEFLKQEEEKEKIEEAKKEAHEETDELEALKKEKKQKTSKETKSRTAKSLIERLVSLLSRQKRTETIIANALYDTYQVNALTDGIDAAGALKSLGPEWGKRMADFRRFSGINALLSLTVTYAAFGGKITEAARQSDKSAQSNQLLETAKEIFEHHTFSK
ncbi:MAG: hypothetical protein PVG30_03280 [Gammaproteobacteria bacterium]|jgi:hypothetical protein